jgi:hypothetical protein
LNHDRTAQTWCARGLIDGCSCCNGCHTQEQRCSNLTTRLACLSLLLLLLLLLVLVLVLVLLLLLLLQQQQLLLLLLPALLPLARSSAAASSPSWHVCHHQGGYGERPTHTTQHGRVLCSPTRATVQDSTRGGTCTCRLSSTCIMR